MLSVRTSFDPTLTYSPLLGSPSVCSHASMSLPPPCLALEIEDRRAKLPAAMLPYYEISVVTFEPTRMTALFEYALI